MAEQAGQRDEPTPAGADDKGRRFVALFAAHQRRIYGLIRSLVFNPTDADDLFQETSTVLWQLFDEYTPGTDFGAWALKIARLRVLKHREKQRTRGRVFGDAVFERVAEEVEQLSAELDRRTEALRGCMSKLPRADLTLLQQRYEEQTSVDQIARREGRASVTIYKRLNRIRESLLDCMRRALFEEC